MPDHRCVHGGSEPNVSAMASVGNKTTAEINKDLVRAAEERIARGDRAGWLSHLAENARWTVMGTTSWSRTYEGKGAILARLIAPLVAQYAEPYRRTIVQLLADGDWVVARCQGRVTTKSGQRYDNQYCFLYRLRDGLIEEIIEYGDTALIERVLPPWSP